MNILVTLIITIYSGCLIILGKKYTIEQKKLPASEISLTKVTQRRIL